MKITELRTKSPAELKDLVLSLKQEQFNLRFQEATGALESKARYKEARKTIARAKTLLGGGATLVAGAKEKPVKAKKAAPAKAAAKKEKKG